MQCIAASLELRVTIGSIEHLLPIVIALIFGFGLIRYARKSSNSLKQSVFNTLGIVVAATVFIFHSYHIGFKSYNIQTDLPLYLCSLMALIIPVFTYFKKYWMFEILLFWIIAGTLQGVITPDIAVGFPSFDYFRYWIVHLGLLIIIVYAVRVFGMRPELKSVFKSFLALQIYVLLMITVNYFLKANYFYLNQKPKSASVLDYFGEWPYYIIVCQLIIIPLFLLIYVVVSFLNNR